MTTPTLTPLHWRDNALVPERPLGPPDPAATASLTILHTNDLHSSIDARSKFGGLARIATTIESARAAGPTLVVDGGDSVFGGGTWWCARDAGATSRLFSRAGYDLAAIGNHDLEHGPHSLRELLAGGRRLVSTNLVFDDQELSRQIPPAYVVALDGFQIGVLGLTTTMTLDLVPASVLQGVRYQDTPDSALRTVAALSPFVHTIIILSHLGFDNADDSDVYLIPALRNSKVSAILGGHSHEALDPAYVIDGITACNAGAHGVNVNKVTMTRNAQGSIEVRARLVPQDDSVPASPTFLRAREQELEALIPLRRELLPVPPVTVAASRTPDAGPPKDRELALLAAALRASGQVATDAIQMVPFLYMLGQLPAGDTVSHLDVLTAYPNTERLLEIDLEGRQLKQLVELQSRLRFVLAALPVWLHDGHEVSADELEDGGSYKVVVSQLVSEGGLGWTALQSVEVQARALDVTCADVVWDYLATR